MSAPSEKSCTGVGVLFVFWRPARVDFCFIMGEFVRNSRLLGTLLTWEVLSIEAHGFLRPLRRRLGTAPSLAIAFSLSLSELESHKASWTLRVTHHMC